VKEVTVLSDAAVKREEELKGMGLKTYDALHVACAEHALVDVVLTTDDGLVQAAARNVDKL
jgi:predicted nucleic acid-binding protein